MKRTVFLVVYPHPDDVEWDIPGTILRLSGEKNPVHYCQVTDGAAGTLDEKLTPEKLRAIRRNETAKAARILGVKKVHHLDHPDGNSYDRQAMREGIVRIIRQVRAEIVLCLDPWREGLTHIDHRNSAWAGIEAASNAGLPLSDYQQVRDEGLAAQVVRQVWLFQTDKPTHYVDVSGTFTAASESMYAHASQRGFGKLSPITARQQMDAQVAELRAAAEKSGMLAGVELAEPFRVLDIGVGHSAQFREESPWLISPL